MTSVLVGYASKHGSTAEIAEVIAEKLREFGLDVDCKPLSAVKGIADYDAVVLGSALYGKRWRAEARRFLERHREELSQRPLWVFSSGPVGEWADYLDPESLEPRRITAETERLGARGHVVFGGRLPSEPRGLVERVMVCETPPRYRDRRQWAEIRRWAAHIANTLASLNPGSPPTGRARPSEPGGAAVPARASDSAPTAAPISDQ